MYLYRIYSVLFVFSLFLFSCSEDNNTPEPEGRTVLVYIAGDNSLSRYGYDNIEQMKAGFGRFRGNLIVYFDPVDDVPKLLKISRGSDGKVVDSVVAVYEEENSADPKILARVAEDTRRLFPAASYGLILWSHGLGWLPANYNFPGAYGRTAARQLPPTKYFAEDQHTGVEKQYGYMDIDKLASALPGGFRFILFDACFMGAVEVLYELRNKTDYIIASPAEVIANGFPYNRIIPLMDGEEAEFKQICREFFNFYNTMPEPDWRSATVSLTKTSELESLAGVVRSILQGKEDVLPDSKASDVRLYTMSYGLPKVYFDFGEYIRSMATKEQFAAFTAQYDKTVVYKLATENFFSEPLPPDKYSGLSSYIPFSNWTNMKARYAELGWFKAVY